MLNRIRIIQIPVLVSLAELLIGCGGQTPLPLPAGNSYNLPPNTTSNTGSTSTPNSTSNTGSTTTTNTTSTTASTIPANLPSPITNSFQLQAKATSSSVCSNPTPAGVAAGTFSYGPITTDNLLKVTLTSNSPTAEPCSTATKYYSCVQWTVTATDGTYTQSQNVKVSYGNPSTGPCAGLPNNQTISFNPSSGHGPITLSVTQPQIDNCRLYYGYANNFNSVLSPGYQTWIAPGNGSWYGGCAMGVAYDNYITSGSMSIQTNTP